MWRPYFRIREISLVRAGVFICALAPAAIFSGLALAQSTLSDRNPESRTSAVMSRAEQEAEQKVSLSADKIVEILRHEPGLLLEVKKMLVKKAYEQGRILDAADLTDEALFRLLREDETIRILATREIEDRDYVRAKPTQASRNREEPYWDQHERDLENNSAPNRVPESNEPYPPSAPGPRPRNAAPQNPARIVERTALQQNEEQFDGVGPNTGGIARIHPEELPDLLNVDSRAAAAARNGVGTANIPPSGLEQPLSYGQLPSHSPDQGPGSYTGTGVPNRFPERSQQARLQEQPRLISSPSDLDQDRPLIRHRPNPCANVPSLYDLYAQVSRRPPMLERFGMDVFRNGTGNSDDLPMDLPAGPDYVLGPGDGLSIELWGGVAQRLQRVVDREGRVALPEVGAVQVSGRSLGDVQHLVQSVLRTQFRDVEADVSLARIRSVRVYVVGDVARPGAYDISSLSTPLNALYAAGGPTSRGSLRHLRHYRGNQLVEEIDAYDLLLH